MDRSRRLIVACLHNSDKERYDLRCLETSCSFGRPIAPLIILIREIKCSATTRAIFHPMTERRFVTMHAKLLVHHFVFFFQFRELYSMECKHKRLLVSKCKCNHSISPSLLRVWSLIAPTLTFPCREHTWIRP